MNNQLGFKRILCVFFGVLVCFALACGVGRAEPKPEMELTLEEFIKQYNTSCGEYKLPKLKESSFKKNTGVMEVRQSSLNPYSVLTVTLNPGKKKICAIMLNSSGDGTEQSGLLIISAMMNTVTALTPDLTSGQRQTLLYQLGFLTAMMDGEKRIHEMNGFALSTLHLEQVGMLLTAEAIPPVEAAPAVEATPPAENASTMETPSTQPPTQEGASATKSPTALGSGLGLLAVWFIVGLISPRLALWGVPEKYHVRSVVLIAYAGFCFIAVMVFNLLATNDYTVAMISFFFTGVSILILKKRMATLDKQYSEKVGAAPTSPQA